ncbi:unnamed protein product [Amoebophrya sp. A25]|nr:unnamed protein product [Amoebophrya sp. A25]|eukprot:GSA25T00003448001.1
MKMASSAPSDSSRGGVDLELVPASASSTAAPQTAAQAVSLESGALRGSNSSATFPPRPVAETTPANKQGGGPSKCYTFFMIVAWLILAVNQICANRRFMRVLGSDPSWKLSQPSVALAGSFLLCLMLSLFTDRFRPHFPCCIVRLWTKCCACRFRRGQTRSNKGAQTVADDKREELLKKEGPPTLRNDAEEEDRHVFEFIELTSNRGSSTDGDPSSSTEVVEQHQAPTPPRKCGAGAWRAYIIPGLALPLILATQKKANHLNPGSPWRMEPLLCLWVFLYGQWVKRRSAMEAKAKEALAKQVAPAHDRGKNINNSASTEDGAVLESSTRLQPSDFGEMFVTVESADDLLSTSFDVSTSTSRTGEGAVTPSTMRGNFMQGYRRLVDRLSAPTLSYATVPPDAQAQQGSSGGALQLEMTDVNQSSKTTATQSEEKEPGEPAVVHKETKRLSFVALALVIVGGFASAWIHHEISIFHPQHHKHSEEWSHVFERTEKDLAILREEKRRQRVAAYFRKRAARLGSRGAEDADELQQVEESESNADEQQLVENSALSKSLPNIGATRLQVSDSDSPKNRGHSSSRKGMRRSSSDVSLQVAAARARHQDDDLFANQLLHTNANANPELPRTMPTSSSSSLTSRTSTKYKKRTKSGANYDSGLEDSADLHWGDLSFSDPEDSEDESEFEAFHWHAAVFKHLKAHSSILGIYEIGPHNAEFVGIVLAVIHSICQAVFLVASKSALSTSAALLASTSGGGVEQEGQNKINLPGQGFATSCWIGMLFSMSVDCAVYLNEHTDEHLERQITDSAEMAGTKTPKGGGLGKGGSARGGSGGGGGQGGSGDGSGAGSGGSGGASSSMLKRLGSVMKAGREKGAITPLTSSRGVTTTGTSAASSSHLRSGMLKSTQSSAGAGPPGAARQVAMHIQDSALVDRFATASSSTRPTPSKSEDGAPAATVPALYGAGNAPEAGAAPPSASPSAFEVVPPPPLRPLARRQHVSSAFQRNSKVSSLAMRDDDSDDGAGSSGGLNEPGGEERLEQLPPQKMNQDQQEVVEGPLLVQHLPQQDGLEDRPLEQPDDWVDLPGEEEDLAGTGLPARKSWEESHGGIYYDVGGEDVASSRLRELVAEEDVVDTSSQTGATSRPPAAATAGRRINPFTGKPVGSSGAPAGSFGSSRTHAQEPSPALVPIGSTDGLATTTSALTSSTGSAVKNPFLPGVGRGTRPKPGGLSKWKVVQKAMAEGDLTKKKHAEKVSDIVEHLIQQKKAEKQNKKMLNSASPKAGSAPAAVASGGPQSSSQTLQLSAQSSTEHTLQQHQDASSSATPGGNGSPSSPEDVDSWTHFRHWIRYYLLDWMWMTGHASVASSVFLIFFFQYAAKFWLVNTLDMLNMTIVESFKMILTVILVTLFLTPKAATSGGGRSGGEVSGSAGAAGGSSSAEEEKAGVVSELQILACMITVAGGGLFKIAEHYEKMIHTLHHEKNAVRLEKTALQRQRDGLQLTLETLADIATRSKQARGSAMSIPRGSIASIAPGGTSTSMPKGRETKAIEEIEMTTTGISSTFHDTTGGGTGTGSSGGRLIEGQHKQDFSSSCDYRSGGEIELDELSSRGRGSVTTPGGTSCAGQLLLEMDDMTGSGSRSSIGSSSSSSASTARRSKSTNSTKKTANRSKDAKPTSSFLIEYAHA